jgi:hypothetical protein
MGTFAEATRNAMLDAYASGTDYTGNASVYIKLHLGDPGAAGTNNAAAETTRKLVSWAAAATGSKASNADTEWTNVSTTETYSHISMWTASSGGTFLGSDDLSSTAAMTAGQTFRIPSGQLTLSLTGPFTDTQKNAMLDSFAGATNYTGTTTFFVKLHLGDPGAAGTSNPATETTRKQFAFSAASVGTTSNTGQVDWTSYPAAESISWVSMWDASTSGTYLGKDQLATTQAMSVGETFRMRVGDIDLGIA